MQRHEQPQIKSYYKCLSTFQKYCIGTDLGWSFELQVTLGKGWGHSS